MTTLSVVIVTWNGRQHLDTCLSSVAAQAGVATETIVVDLSPQERTEYEAERAIYRGFVQQNGIRMSSPSGWGEFIMLSSRSDDGRRAMAARGQQRVREEFTFAAQALQYQELFARLTGRVGRTRGLLAKGSQDWLVPAS